jgi:hypothetical protein
MTTSDAAPVLPTAQIREIYADDGGLAEYHDPIDGHRQRGHSLKEFDLWLAAHDKAIRDAALTEAAEVCQRIQDDPEFESGVGVVAAKIVIRSLAASEPTRLKDEEVEVLSALTDPDPCEWDHNHSCQAHGRFYIPQGQLCPNERARQIVARHLQEGDK